MTATMNVQDALKSLRSPSDLAILRLTEPVYAQQPDDVQDTRLSNASSTVSSTTHDPQVLKADLQHYRDLFSKLRFSYVEQVTKEKFLRAVTADTPGFVDSSQNAQLEEANRESKRLLAEKKEELQGMLSDLEAQSRELARRHNEIELKTTQLEALPIEIEELQARIASLHSVQSRSTDPDLRLPLRESLSLLAQHERESATLDSQIANLRSSLPQKEHDIQVLGEDLGPLEMRKQHALKMLAEAREKRQAGGSDDAELQLQWLRGVEATMKTMLAT